MIVRVWRGHTLAENAEAYFRHVTGSVFPSLVGIHGYRGAEVLRRKTASGVEFVVMTYWESLGAIQEFAGPDAEAAVVSPEAKALLDDFDTFVRHYELALDSARER
jgi:heme-degrading monooxygenase HmoA